MTLAELIPLALRASIFGIVLALGLRAEMAEATWIFRRPKALLLSILAMFVIMPLVALGIDLAFPLAPAVEVALIAIAFSPVPPFLPAKELKSGAEVDKVISLLASASVLSIVLVPLGVHLLKPLFEAEVNLTAAQIAKPVLFTVLVPLVVGVVIRMAVPHIAERVSEPINKVSTILLVLAVLPILVTQGSAMGALIGGGTLLALVAFVTIGLAVGHVLAGPDPRDQTVLALSTASRHPAVALAIGASVTPQQGQLMPAVLLYLIVGVVLSGVYLAIRKKRGTVPSSG